MVGAGGGAGCNVLAVGAAWCHPVAWRGRRGGGANQTLRKLCHLLLSRSIQGYRSAVNWELARGQPPPAPSLRPSTLPWNVREFVCVYLCVCEKKEGSGRRQIHCEHANVVDREQDHKDVMKAQLPKHQRHSLGTPGCRERGESEEGQGEVRPRLSQTFFFLI